MKKINFIILALFLSSTVHAQTTIEKPRIGLSKAANVNLEKIEIKDTATILYFHTTGSPGEWLFITDQTYIQPLNDTAKLFVVASEGIPLSERYLMLVSGYVDYKLIFPKINKSVTKLDYGEANSEGSGGRFIYDIQLKPLPNISTAPQEITGNWFNQTTGDYELSFFDTLAVYKSRVWTYTDINFKKGKGSITLKNNNDIVQLYINGDKNVYHIGESLTSLKPYCKDAAPATKENIAEDKSLETPTFKIDSATLCGYFKGYSPRLGAKTASATVNNIITAKETVFMVEIADNGTFSIKLPLNYPHVVYFESSFYYESVFLIPGKETFLMIDKKNALYIGESAHINNDLPKLHKIDNFNDDNAQKKILDMTPDAYKTYLLDRKQKDMLAVDTLCKRNYISAQGALIKKLDIEYSYDLNILSYNSNLQNAYFKKNKNSTRKEMPPKIEKLPADYYNFITNEIANNPFAVLCEYYETFINRIPTLNIINVATKNYSTIEIADKLEQSGYKFTDEEHEWVNALRQNNTPEVKAYNEVLNNNRNQISALYRAHRSNLQELFKEKMNEEITFTMIGTFFIEKNIVLTPDEKSLIDTLKVYENTKAATKNRELYRQYEKALSNFENNHQSFINKLYNQQMKLAAKENMRELLHLKNTLSLDIINSQEICRNILSNITPYASDSLKSLQKQFTNPLIAEYVEFVNRQVQTTLDANRATMRTIVNEVPKTTTDKLLDAILEKYRGKVVLIDFWAVGDVPSLSAIEQIKPLKEYMAHDNVVFVYITNQTSPLNIWTKAIADIKGEHYRISDDQWNYLRSFFNIKEMPHIALVDKKGVVRHPYLSAMPNNMTKRELDKWIREN